MLVFAGNLPAATPGWNRANELYERTEYRESLAALTAVNPKNAPEWALMGQDYFMLGEYKKATEVLEKAVGLEPNNPGYVHWLGRVYGRRAETSGPFTAPGFANRTREMFERAVALDPNNRAAVDDLFDFYLEAPGFLGGGMHKAEELAQRVAQNDPAQGHYVLALLDDKRKQYDSAEQHLRRAMELAPRQVSRVVDLAKYLAKRGQVKESEAMFDQAMNMAPDTPKILFERADTYVQEKRELDRARELLRKYLRSPLTPEDPPRERAETLLKKIGA